jgi:hypothetical protein
MYEKFFQAYSCLAADLALTFTDNDEKQIVYDILMNCVEGNPLPTHPESIDKEEWNDFLTNTIPVFHEQCHQSGTRNAQVQSYLDKVAYLQLIICDYDKITSEKLTAEWIAEQQQILTHEFNNIKLIPNNTTKLLSCFFPHSEHSHRNYWSNLEYYTQKVAFGFYTIMELLFLCYALSPQSPLTINKRENSSHSSLSTETTVAGVAILGLLIYLLETIRTRTVQHGISAVAGGDLFKPPKDLLWIPDNLHPESDLANHEVIAPQQSPILRRASSSSSSEVEERDFSSEKHSSNRKLGL